MLSSHDPPLAKTHITPPLAKPHTPTHTTREQGTLPDADNEWHRLVSVEFRESLPKNEIQRQSTIFEVMKSERDYVNDVRRARFY